MAKPVYNSAAWRRARAYTLNRDRNLCQLRYPGCTTYADQVDHIIEWSAGGAWYDPANLQAACRYCNVSKRNMGGPGAYAAPRAW